MEAALELQFVDGIPFLLVLPAPAVPTTLTLWCKWCLKEPRLLYLLQWGYSEIPVKSNVTVVISTLISILQGGYRELVACSSILLPVT